MPDLHQTPMGREFFQFQFPELIKAINGLASAVAENTKAVREFQEEWRKSQEVAAPPDHMLDRLAKIQISPHLFEDDSVPFHFEDMELGEEVVLTCNDSGGESRLWMYKHPDGGWMYQQTGQCPVGADYIETEHLFPKWYDYHGKMRVSLNGYSSGDLIRVVRKGAREY